MKNVNILINKMKINFKNKNKIRLRGCLFIYIFFIFYKEMKLLLFCYERSMKELVFYFKLLLSLNKVCDVFNEK